MPNIKVDFEKTLLQLEEIVARLENGDCSLEESIELFEKGMKCTSDCRMALDAAQKRIVELSNIEGSENSDD